MAVTCHCGQDDCGSRSALIPPSSPRSHMQIAFHLYDGFTALDVVGPYDVLRNLPGCEPVFVAEQVGPVRNTSGSLALIADKGVDGVDEADILVVPGGFGTRAGLDHQPTLAWLRPAQQGPPGTNWLYPRALEVDVRCVRARA